MKRRRQIERIIRYLDKAQEIADSLELLNASGGELGSIIGTIATELEVDLANDTHRER